MEFMLPWLSFSPGEHLESWWVDLWAPADNWFSEMASICRTMWTVRAVIFSDINGWNTLNVAPVYALCGWWLTELSRISLLWDLVFQKSTSLCSTNWKYPSRWCSRMCVIVYWLCVTINIRCLYTGIHSCMIIMYRTVWMQVLLSSNHWAELSCSGRKKLLLGAWPANGSMPRCMSGRSIPFVGSRGS